MSLILSEEAAFYSCKSALRIKRWGHLLFTGADLSIKQTVSSPKPVKKNWTYVTKFISGIDLGEAAEHI